MVIKIKNSAEIGIKDGVKVLVYGGSGVGKTRLCATAPRPIVFSAEKGMLSLRKERIPYIEVFSFKELNDAATWAIKSTEAKNFDTFCLDSVSEIAELVVAEEMQKTKDPRKSYPAYQEEMVKIIKMFRDMPNKHVYFIAKEAATKDGFGSVSYGPFFPGNKLPEAAPYYFDQVCRLVNLTDPANGSVYGALKTKKDTTSEGKDRSGALDFWEPPNLTHIFNKIMSA